MRHLTLLLLLFSSMTIFSQKEDIEMCGTSKIIKEALKDSEKKQVMDQLELFTQQFVANFSKQRKATDQIIIPVVVHVIHNYGNENISYTQIENGIARINEDFNCLNDDLSNVIDQFTQIIGCPGIEFRLATKDPDGNCTYGITRTASSLFQNANSQDVMSLINWPDDKYVNIYVVRGFDFNYSSSAGIATKPGTGGALGDYIFCRYDYFGDWNVNSDSGPTGSNWTRHLLSHEMGHFFNLDHPWGNNNNPGDNCFGDDLVEDTPPTAGTDGNYVGCPLDQTTCGDELDNVQNIMDYASCSHMFTQGQTYRMLAAANSLAGNRMYLWQDENLVFTGTDDATWFGDPYTSCAPIPDFISNTSLGCIGTEISFENFAYNFIEEDIDYYWGFPGGSPTTSNETNPTIQYLDAGTYDVSLTTCNGSNCNTIVKENYISIFDEQIVANDNPELQGFESENFPLAQPNWIIGPDYNEQNWERTESAASEGISSLRIKSENYLDQRNSHVFYSPILDLSEFSIQSSNPLQICFDYAYSARSSALELIYSNGNYEWVSPHDDNLIISRNHGCDSDMWMVRSTLSTRPESNSSNLISTYQIFPTEFIPTQDQWSQHCVNILSSAGQSEVRIRFEFIGEGGIAEVNNPSLCNGSLEYVESGGNWLYIDNIKIGLQSEIQEQSYGCGDTNACNYNSNIDIIDNNLCDYPEQYYNCFGSCLADIDCDEICDQFDNCPWFYNPDQLDSDQDGLGDICDATPLSTDELLINRQLIHIFEILGRNTSNNDFQLHIYDDGSVEKRYKIE